MGKLPTTMEEYRGSADSTKRERNPRMPKAHSNQKGDHMKNKHSSNEVSHSGNDNLDTNQSAQSMSAGSDDSIPNTGVNQDSSSLDPQGSESQSNQESSESRDSSTSMKSESDTDATGLVSRAASVLDTQSVKKNLNLVKQKAQDLMSSGKEQVSDKFNSLTDDVKLRGMMVDDSIKANPYAYALGAVGIGFILGRAFSGKGKSDIDALVSTVNKINFGTLAGMFGAKVGSEGQSESSEGYNKDQARKIG
ncbi:MAG: hypothetical protein H7249_02170 [Chitinophagaceae bacterium]|nr:hypothetical protein [Oligoflexus sp.]